jgi:hypothetical protein
LCWISIRYILGFQTSGIDYIILWNLNALTYAISTLSPLTLWVRIPLGEVYSIQHYAIKFVSDLRQVVGFLCVLWFYIEDKDMYSLGAILGMIVCSWIYNYMWNQCLSPLKLWIRTRSWRGVLNTTLCDKFVSDLVQQDVGKLRFSF